MSGYNTPHSTSSKPDTMGAAACPGCGQKLAKMGQVNTNNGPTDNYVCTNQDCADHRSYNMAGQPLFVK